MEILVSEPSQGSLGSLEDKISNKSELEVEIHFYLRTTNIKALFFLTDQEELGAVK